MHTETGLALIGSKDSYSKAFGLKDHTIQVFWAILSLRVEHDRWLPALTHLYDFRVFAAIFPMQICSDRSHESGVRSMFYLNFKCSTSRKLSHTRSKIPNPKSFSHVIHLDPKSETRSQGLGSRQDEEVPTPRMNALTLNALNHTRRIHAPQLRMWGFRQFLQDANHEIMVLSPGLSKATLHPKH